MSYPEICSEISRIRKVRNIGVRQMAKEIGISPATLNRIEHGQTVSVDVAAKIGPWAGKCACCGQQVSASNHSDPVTAFAEWLNAGTQFAMDAGHVVDIRVTTKDGNKLRLTGGAVSS